MVHTETDIMLLLKEESPSIEAAHPRSSFTKIENRSI